MNLKNHQLWMHTHYKEIRAWLATFLAAGVLILMFISLGKIRDLGEDNKNLISQTKALGMQNESLSRQNQELIICVGQAFAKFTRDNLPVTFDDIKKCAVSNAAQSVQPTPDTSQNTTPTKGSQNQQPQNTPQNNNKQEEPKGLVEDTTSFISNLIKDVTKALPGGL